MERLRLGLCAAMTMAGPGCVDRALTPIQCDDGVVVAGEACFGDDHETLRIGFTPIALRAAPFDGDDTVDLLVTGIDAAGAVIGASSRVGADGALAAPQDAGVSGCSAHPAIGAANADAVTDLLVDACDDTMMVFLGETSGGFAAPVTVDVDVATKTSALADIDGDGTPDVIALGIAGEAIALTWARGDGSGGYGPPAGTFVGQLGAPDEPSGFSVGLFDGDTLPDVVLSHGDPNQPPQVALGTGGAFAEPVPWDELPVSRGVASLDVDGDGDDELLVVRAEPAAFEVWRGRMGSLERVARTEMPPAQRRIVGGGDVDGDGALDFGFFDPASSDVDVWLGDGEGGWSHTATVDVGANVEQLAIVDLDGDHAAELIAGTFSGGTVTVVRSSP